MTKPTQLEPMLPAAMIARSLNISTQTVRNWIRTGELLAVNVGRPGGARPRYAVRNDDLNRFLVARRVTATKDGTITIPRRMVKA